MSNLSLTNVSESDLNALAKAMGMSADATAKKQGSTLPRLKIDHKGVEGTATIKGKQNVPYQVVEAGQFCLERLDTDGSKIYQENLSIRLFNQRFMYKRYVRDGESGRYVKSVMGLDLKSDLQDTDGGVNCGRSSKYIEDFDSLPQETKDLMKSIKRVRVLFGLATFDEAIDEKGEAVSSIAPIPFVWEVDNRDAFKTLGVPVNKMVTKNLILPQCELKLSTEEKSVPSGIKFYLPKVSIDTENLFDLSKEDQTTFNDFNEWVNSYNNWVLSQSSKSSDSTTVDVDVAEDVEDVEVKELTKPVKEPKKVKTKKEEAPAPKKDIGKILDEWDDDEE